MLPVTLISCRLPEEEEKPEPPIVSFTPSVQLSEYVRPADRCVGCWRVLVNALYLRRAALGVCAVSGQVWGKAWAWRV